VFAESAGAGKGTTVTWNCLGKICLEKNGPESDAGMSRVLIVEDEAHLAQGLQFNLQAEGHTVELRATASRRWSDWSRKASDSTPWCSIVMLPGKSGFDVAAVAARKEKLCADSDADRARRPKTCCKASPGADDYLPKPFELAILIAAWRAC